MIPPLVEEFCKLIDYPIRELNSERVIGPKLGVRAPQPGTDVKIENVPGNVLENILFPIFSQSGNIYKLRFLTDSNNCIITYNTIQEMQQAMEFLDNYQVLPNHFLKAKKSVEKRKLFIGGIPDHKGRNDIWEQLNRIGMAGIMDVIMYRSYVDKKKNRGFVFIEFLTEKDALAAKEKFPLITLFGNLVQLEWAKPESDILHAQGTSVPCSKLIVKNLHLNQTQSEFQKSVNEVIGHNHDRVTITKVESVGRLMFQSRREAQRGRQLLKNYYHKVEQEVEVLWDLELPQTSQESRLEQRRLLPLDNSQMHDVATGSMNDGFWPYEELPENVKSIVNYLDL